MNSKALRRLATDHGTLHSQPLPPNYLFAPSAADSDDDLTQLDILLAGPSHTPFAAGVWKLHLTIPHTYPQQPPTAHFRTTIFHPNVDPQTGGVCVETLKRDWDSKLTLRDVLVTISCLLIQPNPDSALNAEAGALIQEDFSAFARRAELMTSIQAAIPQNLADAVKEAQHRGQEFEIREDEGEDDQDQDTRHIDAPARRRRATAKQKGTAPSRRSDGSPSAGVTRRRRPPHANPFAVQTTGDDVFGSVPAPPSTVAEDDNSSMMDENQENDESRSPTKGLTPKVGTPRRPLGAPVPLGELSLEDPESDSSEDDEEPEYPPSPRKSPMKRRTQHPNTMQDSMQAESSHMAAARDRNITPANNLNIKPLARDSPFVDSSFMEPLRSPQKKKGSLFTPGLSRTPLFSAIGTPKRDGGIFKRTSPSSADKRREEAERKAGLKEKLWELCGRDVGRWNRGEFDGEPFAMKARRW